jgi:hypothetical protein
VREFVNEVTKIIAPVGADFKVPTWCSPSTGKWAIALQLHGIKILFTEGGDAIKHPWRLALSLWRLLALLFIPAACTPNEPSIPTPSSSMVSVVKIHQNYAAYEGQLVSIRGYGAIMMSTPLCPRYVGMDTRLSFVDETNSSIYAVVTASASGAERSDNLCEFQGYMCVYNEEIGCPGSLQTATFPYLEIVAIK